jgi:hypothetical protein
MIVETATYTFSNSPGPSQIHIMTLFFWPAARRQHPARNSGLRPFASRLSCLQNHLAQTLSTSVILHGYTALNLNLMPQASFYLVSCQTPIEAQTLDVLNTLIMFSSVQSFLTTVKVVLSQHICLSLSPGKWQELFWLCHLPLGVHVVTKFKSSVQDVAPFTFKSFQHIFFAQMGNFG